jgi:hypothetical protein
MASEPAPLSAEDESVLRRVAERIVELHMEVPAILTIESSVPMSVVAGQAMHFFQPLVQALFRFPDYERFAALVERRDALERLMRLIELRADEVRPRGRERGSR